MTLLYLVVGLIAAAAAFQPHAQPPLRRTLQRPRRVEMFPREPPPRSRTEELLAAADERLGETAPSSWADLGNPKQAPEPVEVDPLLQALPLGVAAFALLIFV